MLLHSIVAAADGRACSRGDMVVVAKPGQGMLEPIFVVALREMFPGMCTATLRPPNCRAKTDTCLGERVVELE